jgi:hypothetical protein
MNTLLIRERIHKFFYIRYKRIRRQSSAVAKWLERLAPEWMVTFSHSGSNPPWADFFIFLNSQLLTWPCLHVRWFT